MEYSESEHSETKHPENDNPESESPESEPSEIERLAGGHPTHDYPRIHVRTDLDDLYEMSGAIFHAFAAKDQTLLEMTLKKANLEDVFLELTEKEEADDDSRI